MFASVKGHATPLLALSVVLLFTAGEPLARAAAPSASAAAWDMQVNVSVLGNVILDLGHDASVQTADQTTSFADNQSVVSFDSGAGLLARLTTGDIQVSTQWNPGASFQVVGAQAGMVNVDLGAVSVLGGSSLLSVTANQIVATALVSGTCPATPPAAHVALTGIGPAVNDFVFTNGFEAENLMPTSEAQLPGLAVALQGTPLANIPVNPSPNTELSLSNVLTLKLNEQTVSGDGISSRGVATNALHLSVNVVGLITADVILSHAEASITCH